MSEYVTNLALGATTPLVAKDKGDFSNRVNCMGAQIGNNAKAFAKDVVVIGGTAVAAKAAVKNKKFANAIANPLQKAVNKIRTGRAWNELRTEMQVVIKKFKALPNNAKIALAVVGGLGALALGAIEHNRTFKMGQIDQKYTDKAQIEKETNKALK